MRLIRTAVAIVGLLALMAIGSAAHATKRVALVIGNDRYPNLPATEQLQKAVNDARTIGDALGRIGFEVIRGENLGRAAMVDKLDELTRKLSPGDTAFFFFAGHGVAISGGNFILPSDVPSIDSGQETRLARAALGETDIVADLQGRGVRVAVVVLDACRKNPFRRPGVRSVGGEKGFVRSDPAQGVFSMYSAGVGQTALDRLSNADNNPNSVFTRVLAPLLVKPGIHLGDLAHEVREKVNDLAKTVGHVQRPASYDETIGGRVYLAGTPPAAAPAPAAAPKAPPSAPVQAAVPPPPAPAPVAAPAPALVAAPKPAPDACASAEVHWRSAEAVGTEAAFEDHVKRFPNCAFSSLAKVRIDVLKRQAALRPATPAPAPAAPAAPASGGIAGTWSGSLAQPDNKKYEVTIKIDASGNGTIDYTTLKCGGTLAAAGRSGAGFVFKENLTYGTNCTAGDITLIPSGNSLRLEWRQFGFILASGVLNASGR